MKCLKRVVVAGLLWLACVGAAGSADQGSDREQPQGASGGNSVLLMFEEQERGLDAYATRMVLNDHYLRIDDGVDSNDFVLFDRDKRVIYSVSAARKTILTIHPKAVEPDLPFEVRLTAERQEQSGLPPVAGKAPVRYRFRANERPCYEVVAVPELLQSAVGALREYQRVLSQEHAAHVHKIPVELQDACDLAMNVTAPGRHLDFGFPVHFQSAGGRVRRLLDYEEAYLAAPALFQLPRGYLRFSVEDMQQGR